MFLPYYVQNALLYMGKLDPISSPFCTDFVQLTRKFPRPPINQMIRTVFTLIRAIPTVVNSLGVLLITPATNSQIHLIVLVSVQKSWEVPYRVRSSKTGESEELIRIAQSSSIHKQIRGNPQPSDHAPVSVELNWPPEEENCESLY